MNSQDTAASSQEKVYNRVESFLNQIENNKLAVACLGVLFYVLYRKEHNKPIIPSSLTR